MPDIKKLLEEGDPLRSEQPLSAVEAQVLRTAMLEAAVVAPRNIVSAWHRPLAVAVVLIVLIGLGGITSDRAVTPATEPAGAADVTPAAENGERRQIQFATPGGTRIIWILDPQFSLQDSLQEMKP